MMGHSAPRWVIIVPRVEICGIFHKSWFTAEHAEVAEATVNSNLCVLCGES